MKKYGILLGILVGVMVMVGCVGDTELRWKNVSSNTATDIRWVDYSGDESDVVWNENLADTDYSNFKKVNATHGWGECDLGGGAAQIDVDNDTNPDTLSLNEGSSETYNIYGVAK